MRRSPCSSSSGFASKNAIETMFIGVRSDSTWRNMASSGDSPASEPHGHSSLRGSRLRCR